jgi:hypothetical protein
MNFLTTQIDRSTLFMVLTFAVLLMLMVYLGAQAAHIGTMTANSTLPDADENLIETIEDTVEQISSPFCYWACSITR